MAALTEPELRQLALERAVCSSPRDTPTTNIISRAEAFLTFLKDK